MPIAISRRQPNRLLSDTRRRALRFGGGYFLKYVEHPVAVTLSIAWRLSAAQGRSVFGRIATGYIARSSTSNEKEIFLPTSASDVLRFVFAEATTSNFCRFWSLSRCSRYFVHAATTGGDFFNKHEINDRRLLDVGSVDDEP